MAKLQFYPLDLTYKVINERPVIFIFGRMPSGQQAIVLEHNFKPYFYILLKKGVEKQDFTEKIKNLSVNQDAETYRVIEIAGEKKLLHGRELDLLKIFVNVPKAVPAIKNSLTAFAETQDCFEADIPFIRRYLVDKKITPLCLCEAEGEEVVMKSKADIAIKADKISQASMDTLENYNILAFDIETYNPFGKRIVPEQNPILMIALKGKDFRKVITWKKFRTELEYVDFVESEADLLRKFKEIIEAQKPDIIAGYYSDGFDFPYIQARAEKYRIRLDLGIDFSSVKISKKSESSSAQITGIVHLDAFKFIKKIMGRSLDFDSYSLNPVAEKLLGEKKEAVDLDELADIWDNKIYELEKFCKYNLQDASLTYRLCEKILPSMIELVKIVGIPVFEANRMGFSQLVEWYLIKQTPEYNELIPNKPSYKEVRDRRLNTYKGAFVYEPEPGLYRDIVIFDFRSLYPSIISAHNISIGTLNCDCCQAAEQYWFCKKKKGFVSALIEDLVVRRMRIKELMKKEKKEGEPNIFLDARQNSLKLLANSFYGYLGFYAARWYSIECAKSVTAYGRSYITKTIDEAKNSNFRVVYSDTDSIFLTLDGRTENDAREFGRKINAELPGMMELEYEGFYPAGLFVSAKLSAYGAKKKYALLCSDGKIKIKGFETIRRNWSFIAKEVQEKVINMVLKERDGANALNFVRETIKELRENKIALEKVTIHTQLQKDMESYDNVGPHVAAARRMKALGQVVGAGTIIKFVVVKGTEIIRERARLPEEVSQDDYDADYYINNQVVPSVERIFNVLGYKKEDLLEDKKQSRLNSFFS